jgi:hypothetical protein
MLLSLCNSECTAKKTKEKKTAVVTCISCVWLFSSFGRNDGNTRFSADLADANASRRPVHAPPLLCHSIIARAVFTFLSRARTVLLSAPTLFSARFFAAQCALSVLIPANESFGVANNQNISRIHPRAAHACVPIVLGGCSIRAGQSCCLSLTSHASAGLQIRVIKCHVLSDWGDWHRTLGGILSGVGILRLTYAPLDEQSPLSSARTTA